MKHLPYDDEYESDNVDQNDVVWMTTCCPEKESQVKNVLSLDPQKWILVNAIIHGSFASMTI